MSVYVRAPPETELISSYKPGGTGCFITKLQIRQTVQNSF